jgi:hypothetical protein
MSDAQTTTYLDRLLELFEEKLKRFRLSLTLLLIGTTAFFFLIFFPYMTLLGNRENCRVNQQSCTKLEKNKLDERFSEVTTNWGKIPISTAEVTVLFPLGVAFGFVNVVTQLPGLMRLRRAITQQVKALNNNMDVTIIAPLLIDPKQSAIDQISGGIVLILPFLVFLFSVNMILIRLETLRNKLPYIQNVRFYHSIYLLSALMATYSLVKLGYSFLQENRFEKNNQSDHPPI